MINVEVDIIDYSNSGLESVRLYWKYNAEDGPFSEVLLENELDNTYIGQFPQLNSSSEIEYYIIAKNILENTVSHPNAGWHIFTTIDSILGDVNNDNDINVQDIILTVNFVLNSEYNNSADLNSDSTVDILDIVQLVDIILN